MASKANVAVKPSAVAQEKPEAKPSTKLDAKPSTKIDAKPSTKLDAKPSTKLDAKPSTKLAGKPPEKPPVVVPFDVKMIWVIIVVLICIGASATYVMFKKYEETKRVKRPYKEVLANLRREMAAELSRPDLHNAYSITVAEAVENLPSDIQTIHDDYSALQQKYRTLLKKTVRSSLGPWKLYERSLYYFSKEKKTWYDAESFCVSRDAHLASILDDEEQNFTSSQLQQPSWIGLIVENKDGKWRWIDGSRLVKQYWSRGKPNRAEVFGGSSQDCTFMGPSLASHNWKGENCYKLYGWICKENLDHDGP